MASASARTDSSQMAQCVWISMSAAQEPVSVDPTLSASTLQDRSSVIALRDMLEHRPAWSARPHVKT